MNFARVTAPRILRNAAARPQAAPTQPPPSFARCEVFTTIDGARASWLELEACASAPPYQSLAFLKAWLATIGRAGGVTPFIVVARDSGGRLEALLPFGVTRVGPFRIASFLGGKDSNFNMGLYRPGLYADRAALLDLLSRAAAFGSPQVDGFHCLNQPAQWQGAVNPMVALGGRQSPSAGHKTLLGDDFAGWVNAHYSREAHKKLRKKAQRLAAIGPVGHRIARNGAEAAEFLDAFVGQKTARMRELGLSHLWNPTLALAFLHQAREAGSLELHALYCGDEIVAAFGGLVRDDRLCGMFISHRSDPQFARCSPGELLLNEIVRNLIDRRFAAFDLGVGEARYKAHCCETEEPLFDTFVATSFSGAVLGAFLSARQRVKRSFKQSPVVWAVISRLRKRWGEMISA